MSEYFHKHYEEAKEYFAEGLPYWCDVFSRPTDKEFANYLNSRGFAVQYLILEIFEQVYIPVQCDLDTVIETAKIRSALRREGKLDSELPIYL